MKKTNLEKAVLDVVVVNLGKTLENYDESVIRAALKYKVDAREIVYLTKDKIEEIKLQGVK